MAREILAGVIEAVLSGALDPTTARTVAYVLQVEGRLREGSELEARIDVLERELSRRARDAREAA